ncbi:MAG: CoA pyrophosphatase [Bacillota bacterium]|nr:CoA pyrophosphatase [Bacillota bacterium]
MDKYDIIATKLRDYQPNVYGVRRVSSVVIPLIEVDGETHILYEKRSSKLRMQPGDISFPGGRKEEGETERETAIRETCEELGIRADQMEILGRIDSLNTSFENLIHCFVARIRVDFASLRPSEDEVEELFTVPLRWLQAHEPQRYRVSSHFVMSDDFPFEYIPNGRNYDFRGASYPVLIYPYGDRIIWGLTARLTELFLRIERA